MGAKYTIPNAIGIIGEPIQLSDGTPVWLPGMGGGNTAIQCSIDRASVTTIATLGAPGAVSVSGSVVCCDGSDNIFVAWTPKSGSDVTYPCYLQAFKKGSGHAWAAVGSPLLLNGGPGYPATLPQSMLWCDTGGGTSGAGHLVLASADLESATEYQGYVRAIDAGALLNGSLTVTSSSTTIGQNGQYTTGTTTLAADGFGATNGVILLPEIYSGGAPSTFATYLQSWSITSAGALSLPGQASIVGNSVCQFLVRVSSGTYLTALTNGSGENAIQVINSTPAFGSSALLGSPTNWPGGINYCFADPDTPGRAWLIAGGSPSGSTIQVWRLQLNVAGGTPSVASAATADDTVTIVSGQSSTGVSSVVVQPRVSEVDWYGWYDSSGTYVTFGDYTAFASAPNAPTLTSPANAAYTDVSSGVTLEATYNSTDGTAQNAYALRIKTSGAASYSYWNASTSALQSSIVWNSDSVALGASWSVALPSSVVADGNTYNWSMASQESGQSLQGPFATDFTFTAQAPPSVTVTAPSGTETGTTQPIVAWTPAPASGAVQIAYEIIVESGSFATTPGSGTQAWTSGVVQSSATSATVGTALTPNLQYRAFVQITETGGQTSAWGYTTFTVQVDVPATPVLTASPTNDPTTGCPMIELSVQALDNYLSAADASFESGIGTASGSNCSVAQSTAEALDGSYSLAITPASPGNVSVDLGPYSVVAGQTYNAFAAFRSASASRECTVEIAWVGASGSVTSTGDADSDAAWTQSSPSGTVPSGLIATGTAPTGTTGCYVVANVEATASGIATDSGPNNQPLTVPATGIVAVPSPAGSAFGQAAEIASVDGQLVGPAGTTNAQGAVTGSAFTAECLYTPSASDLSHSLLILGREVPAEWYLASNQAGAALGLNWIDSGGTSHLLTYNGLAAGTTYALAATWDGSTVRLFVNGALEASAAVSSAKAPSSQSLALVQGQGVTSGGVIDEVRISNVARYTAAYTPATAPFTSDANTGCLYHLDAEVHYLDCVALKPYVANETLDGGSASSDQTGSIDGGNASSPSGGDIDGGGAMLVLNDSTTWSAGGFVGSTVLQLTRQDGSYVRGASQANPATVPATTQLVTIDDYEVVQGEGYTYSAVVVANGGSKPLSSSSGTGSATALSFQGWWFLDPTIPSTAVGGLQQSGAPNPVTVTDWAPVTTAQATGHMVMATPTLTYVQNLVMNQDFVGTAELFSNASYLGLEAILTAGKTFFVSSPWGTADTGYFVSGPSTGGLSTGAGVQAKNTKLMASAAPAGHRTVSITAVAQPRPSV